jgi:hypothetical protein
VKGMTYGDIETMPTIERGFYLKRLLQQLKKEAAAAKGK